MQRSFEPALKTWKNRVMSTSSGDQRWVVEIDATKFADLKKQERFWQLLALARAVNALRFVHAALLRHNDTEDSPDARRTRFNSFFFNCALLFEALLLVERLSKNFRDVPEFEALRDLLKDRTVIELRKSSLGPLRDRLAFHFDEAEIGAQLHNSDLAPQFVAGEGTVNQGVYYEMADACAIGAFSGLQLNKPGVVEHEGQLGLQIGNATDVANRFVLAAENFLAAVLDMDGWNLREIERVENYTLGDHLVIFLDVLGQRDKFRDLQLPKSTAEEAHVKEVLRQTAGTVVGFRKLFRTSFEAFQKGMEEGEWGAHAKLLPPKFTGFSDTFVTSVALRNEGDELLPIVRVFSALSAAATVMLTSLSQKHPMRGGIDVGLATEIGPQEIYGTALEQGYKLECKVAQYPRIVIGDEFIKYLDAATARFEGEDTPLANSAKRVLQKIKTLITTDADGSKVLDYLGPVIVEQGTQDRRIKDNMVAPAYEFLLAEQKRIITTEDSKLISRYAAFRAYFESRLTLWGIQPHNP